jgi:hypothetical protein
MMTFLLTYKEDAVQVDETIAGSNPVTRQR